VWLLVAESVAQPLLSGNNILGHKTRKKGFILRPLYNSRYKYPTIFKVSLVEICVGPNLNDKAAEKKKSAKLQKKTNLTAYFSCNTA
jgi:hypothetical protein